MRARPASGLTMLLVLTAALPAVAGNNYSFLIGGRAAGMSGAYTALSDEASTAWYNPAGLGFNDRSSLDVSASAYYLEIIKAPGLVRTRLPARESVSDYNATSFQIVPTSLSYVFFLGDREAPAAGKPRKHSLALSVFVPNATKYNKRIAIDAVDSALRPDGSTLDFRYHQWLQMQQEGAAYYLGPSWGMEVADGFAVGASLFVTYTQATSRPSFGLTMQNPENADESYLFTTYGGEVSFMELGLAAAAGVQYRPIPELRFGLMVRAPAIRLYHSASGSVLNSGGGTQAAGSLLKDETVRQSGLGFHRTTPVSTAFGIAYVMPGVFALSADVEAMTPFEDAEADIDYKWVVNGRLGAEVRLSPMFLLTFGGFTDFAPQRSYTGFASSRVHFFGGTAALTILNGYDVSGSPKTNRITFASTFGLKYAYGFGKVIGLELEPLNLPAENAVRDVKVPLHAHNLSIIIGSSILF